MSFLKPEYNYITKLSTVEISELVNGQLNRKGFFGQEINKGFCNNSTFELTKGTFSRTGGFPVKMIGSFNEQNGLTEIKLTFKYGRMTYLFLVFFILMGCIFFIVPNATINGKDANFTERVIFGIQFIVMGTGVIAFLNFLPIRRLRKEQENLLQLEQKGR